MIDEFLTKTGIAIKAFLAGFFNVGWIPEIWFWYWWLLVLFVACGAVIWLFGWSKIVRIIASMAFLFGAIFTAGGWYMQRRLDQREAAKPKPKPAPPRRKDDGSGFFRGWR